MLATDIYNWCIENDLWGDNIIYFKGKAWSNSPTWGSDKGKQIASDLYEYRNRKASDYFEYANDETLSMSFEGSLNYVLNAYVRGWVELEHEFQKIFEKHGFYYEMGHAWNLAAYEL
jgi:hypothetical protein